MLDSGKSPLDPVEQLHALATEAASQESQSLADAADFNRHYETIVRPYDAAWNIIGDELYSKDPVRIIRALERLAETGRTAGDDDWLKSLADDQSNTLGTPERAIALAVRAVVCGDHFDEAAAASLASLVGRDPHASVERLRRPPKKKADASKPQPAIDSAATLQEAKSPDRNLEISRPAWNPDTRTLSFNSSERKFLEQAKNAQVVLNAFQEIGWPTRMDDPDPRGANASRVHNTVATLNRIPIGIKFSTGDGGQSYIWEPAVEN